jgi:hypothetical protein
LRASAAVDDCIGDFEAFLGADEYFVQVALAFGGDILLLMTWEYIAHHKAVHN